MSFDLLPNRASVQVSSNEQSTALRWAKLALAGVCLAGCVGMAAGQSAQEARLLGPVTFFGQGSFSFPTGIALDSAGNVYVSEYIDDIIKFPFSGGSYGTPVTVASGLDRPLALTVDSTGNIYFATDNKIEKIPYSGASYGSPGVVASGFNSLEDIKLDSGGNLYVTDSGPNAVSKIPYSAGSYGSPVTLASGLNHAGGVALDNKGNVFVTISEGVQVIPYNSGSYGAPVSLSFSGSLFFPSDIAVDGSGNIFVIDDGRIKELVYNGGLSQGYGGPKIVGSNSFYELALDSAGSVYAAGDEATQSGQIDSLAKIGPVQPVIDFGASNVGLASPVIETLYFSIDEGGTIDPPFVVTQGSQSLDFADTGTGTCTTNGPSHSYDSEGEVCTVVVSFTPSSPGVRSGAVIIATSLYSGQLAIATLQGTGTGARVTYPPGAAPQYDGGSSGLDHPYGVVSVVAGNGYTNTYLTGFNPNGGGYIGVTKFTSSGGTAGRISCGSCHPAGLAVDQTGRIIFSDISDNTVKLFTQYDLDYSNVPFTVATGFYQPMGLAVDAVGNIYVADTNNSVIKKIPYTASGLDPNDSYAYDQYDYGTPVVLGSGFNYPEGVAVDGSGNVYVADTYNGAIKKIPYSAGTYGTPVTVASGLNYPAGIVLDGGGNIYVADQGSNSIKKIPYSGGSYGTPVNLNSSGLDNPVGLAIDIYGNLTLTEPGPNHTATIDLSDAPSLGFGSTPAGSTSATQTVTLANTGNFPLTLVPPATGNNPSVSFGFLLDNSSTCPQLSAMSSSTQLAAGASCTEVLAFTPMDPGGPGILAGGTLTLSDKLSIPSATVMQSVSLIGKQTQAVPVITLSPVAITYGSSQATLTATIGFTFYLVPTGSLTFQVDSGPTLSGTCSGTSTPLSCTVASYPTAGLSVGSHTITVAYSGDYNYIPASNTATLTVNAPTATITVAPVTIPHGTATAMLSGTVSFNGPMPVNSLNFKVDNGSVYSSTCTLAASVLSCSVASYATAGLSVGPHTITAGLNDVNYGTVSNTATLTVTALPPTVSVPNLSTTYGASSITVSPIIGYTGATAPTGMVSVKVDSGASVAATCASGASPLICSASYPTGRLTTGGHTITVSIAADTNYASAANTGSLTITPGTPTVTVPTVSTTYGTATTALSASIVYLAPTAPTGAVSFKVDSGTPVTAICSGVASPLSCLATYSTASLSAGGHTITVATAADANYTATSTAGALTVTPATPSITVPAVSTTYGAATATLSATVAYAASSAPTGTVLFKVDSGASVVAACSGATSPLLCSASYVTGALTTGVHTITVSISADSSYVAASNSASLTVGKQGSGTTLGANPTSITPIQTTTLTAVVSAASSGSPTGTVTFYDNGAPLGSPVPVSGGQAQLSTLLPPGAQTISATYSGDGNFLTSSATTGAAVMVAPLDFSLAASSSVSLSVVPGSSGTVSFNVAPLYQVYPGPVSFSVSGLPSGTTYTITPASIPANGGAQTVTVVIATPTALAKSIVPARSAPIAMALCVPLVLLGLVRRRRGWLSVLVLLLGLCAGSAVVGCGANNGNGLFGQAPQTYPVVITVTSGTMQHTINVTLQIL